jgi:hypothetical protein
MAQPTGPNQLVTADLSMLPLSLMKIGHVSTATALWEGEDEVLDESSATPEATQKTASRN